jgi:hypothetical protein
MNALNYAVKKVKQAIPMQILSRVYGGSQRGFNARSVDSALRDSIACYLLEDLSLHGGEEISLSTGDADGVYIDDNIATYHYSRSKLGGRSIVTVTDFSEGYAVIGGSCRYGCDWEGHDTGDIDSIYGKAYEEAQMLTLADNPRHPGGTSRVRIRGENTIQILDVQHPPHGFFTVIIGHESDFSDLPPKTLPYFAKVAVVAIKAEIYTNYVLTLGEGDISRGYELTGVATIINSYEDAIEKYEEYKARWEAVMTGSDTRRTEDHILSQISPLDIR